MPETSQPAPQTPEQKLAVPSTPAISVASETVPSDERIFAVIGYIAFLFVIPLLVKPKSKFCQHHAKQSMVMFLIFIVVLMGLLAVPFIGSLLTLALFALYILAIYRAFRGDLWNIPIISTLSSKIDLSILYSTAAGVSVKQLGSLKEKVEAFGSKVTEGVQNLGSQEQDTKKAPENPPSPPPAQPAKQ